LIEIKKGIITIKMQSNIQTIAGEPWTDDGIEHFEWHEYGPEGN
jgi:hypothetical protein